MSQKTKTRKIYIVGFYGSSEYINWMQGERTHEMKEADLVVFTGGEDVDPSLYNKRAHVTTSSNRFRDNVEVKAFREAKALGKPMLGICRGAQLLCVMNGGILVQHQRNPAFIHGLETYDGKKILTSSTHHQAAYPFLMPAKKYRVLGWTTDASPFHYGETYADELNPPQECEVVYYPKFRCLGIQGHPEMMFDYMEAHPELKPSIEYFQDLLNKFMSGKIKA